MSDDPEGGQDGGTLVRGPWTGDSSYVPPPMLDYSDIPEAPPESPEETTMELPRVPAAPDPATALRSEGISAPEIEEVGSEYGESEYAQPRSFADRLGDWLEFRLQRARALHESEGPFREAEIARKVALLEARTAQETALMEQNGKFHAALMKAKGDKAAARGKAGADRAAALSAGAGTDKGTRTKSGAGGGGTGPSRNNSGGTGGRSGSGSPGGGTGGRGGTKGPDRPSGGRNASPAPDRSPGGARGGQAGSGGSGRDSGGGRNPASSARQERARGRQERAGLRQAGRQERRTAGHAADVADRTNDRDQTRAHRQQAWEDRRARRSERDAARRAKRDAGAGRTTLGQAIAEEAERRFTKRRADALADKDAKPAAQKVNLTKNTKPKGSNATDPTDPADAADKSGSPSNPGKGTPASGAPGTAGKTAGKPSGGTKKRRRRRRRTTGTRRRAKARGRTGRTGRTRRARSDRAKAWKDPFGPENDGPTVEWLGRPAPAPPPAGAGDDIVDAVIVDDGDSRRAPSSPPPVTTGVRGLPPAPERYFARPGTTRPTGRPRTEGSSVSSTQVTRRSRQGPLAAQHRTDITFDDYLMEMANIAIGAASDQDSAETLSKALDKVANALRAMSADLIGDHNISTAVTDLIANLADCADRMKTQAQRCATECGLALEAAKLAAAMVARVYGQDMAAKEDAGLAHASAAAHHD